MSISSSSSAALSGWRILVVGTVAALAVGIGAAAGSFLLTNRTGALGAATSYVPADAAFYVELRIQPSAGQDAALRELLGRFPAMGDLDLDQPLYDQLTERLDEALADEDAPVSWSADVAPWFDGHLGFAVTDVPEMAAAPMDPMGMPPVPSMVALVGVTDRAAAAASIARLLAEADAPSLTEETYAGATIFTWADDPSQPGAYALTDDQLVIGSDADAVRTALDTHGDRARSLAGSSDMSGLVGGLPDDWIGFMSYDLTEVIASSLDAAGEEDAAMADILGELLEHQPARGAMAISAEGDRLAIDGRSDAPTGPFTVANADRGLSDEVPNDALYYSEGGSIGPALAALIEQMKLALAELPGGEDQVAEIESALGADLEEVVSWIGDGAMAIGYDGTAPYGGLILVPTDVDAANRRIDQLLTFASLAAMDPSGGFSVDESEVGGVTVTTIRVRDLAADVAPAPVEADLAVQVAVTDDRAIIGVGEGFVGRVLELDEADSLAAHDRFTQAIDELDGADAAATTWLDLSATRQAIEGALEPMLGGEGEGFYETEILPWLSPLDRLVSVSRVEGDVLVQRVVLVVE